MNPAGERSSSSLQFRTGAGHDDGSALEPDTHVTGQLAQLHRGGCGLGAEFPRGLELLGRQLEIALHCVGERCFGKTCRGACTG